MIKNTRNLLILILFIQVLPASAGVAQSYDSPHYSTPAVWLKNKIDSVKASTISPTGAMIRSLLFPGLGQLYNKKIFKAILIFGLETGLIVNSIYLNQKYKEWDQKYKESEPGSEQDIIFSNREFYINNRNKSNWWLVGVILYSMADAFVDAHLANFDESSDLSYINIIPHFAGQSIGVQLSVSMMF